MNFQTYFDVVAHSLMNNSYALSSMFSTTGLYLKGFGKLRGKTLLEGAVRKTLTDQAARLTQVDVHTKEGLVFSYTKKLKIFIPRTSKFNAKSLSITISNQRINFFIFFLSNFLIIIFPQHIYRVERIFLNLSSYS